MYLVRAKANEMSARRVQLIKEAFHKGVVLWHNDIWMALSRPYPGKVGGRYVKNTSNTPYMRTGDLRRSIPTYRISHRTTFGPKGRVGTKVDLDQTVITLTQHKKAPWTTYGEELENWDKQPTQLTGWKGRAYEALANRIDKHVKYMYARLD